MAFVRDQNEKIIEEKQSSNDHPKLRVELRSPSRHGAVVACVQSPLKLYTARGGVYTCGGGVSGESSLASASILRFMDLAFEPACYFHPHFW